MSYCILKLTINKVFKNSKECVLLEEVGDFRGFRVFDFGPYTKIENSEKSEIFTALVYSKECVLLEEVGDFPVQSCSLDMGQHAQVTFLCNGATCRLRQHYIGHFPAKTFLCALGQHCTSNFIKQCCLRSGFLAQC